MTLSQGMWNRMLMIMLLYWLFQALQIKFFELKPTKLRRFELMLHTIM